MGIFVRAFAHNFGDFDDGTRQKHNCTSFCYSDSAAYLTVASRRSLVTHSTAIGIWR